MLALFSLNIIAHGETSLVHPGLLHSREDLDFVKARIAANEQPWKEAFDQLKALNPENRNPSPRVSLSPSSNHRLHNTMIRDGSAAYACALLWYYSGDQKYADHAIEILNAWNIFESHDNWLFLSWAVPHFLNAAEIIRYSQAGWSSADQKKFESMVRNYWLTPMQNNRFVNNGMHATIEGNIAVAIYLDDEEEFNNAVNKWRKWVPAYIYIESDGRMPTVLGRVASDPVRYWSMDPADGLLHGQSQESCRDLHHVKLGVSGIMFGAEMAYHQGVDLWMEERERLSACLELHAGWMTGSTTVPSSEDLCRIRCTTSGGTPPCQASDWEMALGHFVNRMGMDLPNLENMVDSRRPRASITARNIKFENLTHAYLPYDTIGAPKENGPRSKMESTMQVRPVGNVKADGYRGIWFDLGQRSEFGSKYSGGLGTYTAKHHPLAVYAPEVRKTFFVYGGTTQKEERHLLAMIGYYDHDTKQVPKPVVVHDKEGVDDPHDNPSLQIDDQERLWVFVSGRGSRRPGHIYRSRLPYDIEAFEHLPEREFTYPQPWWIKDEGFVLLFTKYTRGRELYWNVSDADGDNWTADRKLAGMGGHYQVSKELDGRLITAFNMHPEGVVDRRTNLYFVQTSDRGQTWQTVEGETLETPITDPATPALVRNYRAKERLVYVKDIGFDRHGNPVILYLSSSHHQPGPGGDPRTWTIAHRTDGAWAFQEVTTSTHNYDMGSLYIETDGLWRIIAPTEPGPQHHGTGGEVAIWISEDEGKSWAKGRDVTRDSPRNHGYVRRPVNAHPDFYGFWADGNPDQLSESLLYFTDKSGEQVWSLPYNMDAPYASPTPLDPSEQK